MALLGATAWLLQTRMEVAVYVSAPQRHMHSPRAVDLRRLNRIIRWVQCNPRGLTHKQLPEPRIRLAIDDSAFQSPSEEDIVSGKDPLVMRGYILARAHRTDGRGQPTTANDGGGGPSGTSTAVEASTTITRKAP